MAGYKDESCEIIESRMTAKDLGDYFLYPAVVILFNFSCVALLCVLFAVL